MIRHRWDLPPQQAMQLQRRLAGEVRQEALRGPIRTVAGADCAFLGGGGRIIAAAVLCDARTMQPIDHAHVVRPCRYPYVPGLLSFREAPAVIEAVRKLPRVPDLLLCDGQGQAHPRGLGLASHVGLLLDIPTIGVAKSRLCGEHGLPAARRGSRRRLLLDGRTIGVVLRTRANVRCVYVSVGHRVTLDEAVRWTLRCGRGLRVPEPTRLADRYVAKIKRAQRAEA